MSLDCCGLMSELHFCFREHQEIKVIDTYPVINVCIGNHTVQVGIQIDCSSETVFQKADLREPHSFIVNKLRATV